MEHTTPAQHICTTPHDITPPAAAPCPRLQLTTLYDKYVAKYASMIPRASSTKPAESSTTTTKKEE